jgi:cytoskeleton protein RodZ
MRLRYLQALETDSWDDLPGRTYARAFLRTYATALGLDADRFVSEFDEQVPLPPELEEVPAPPPRRRRMLPLAAAPVAAAIALVVVLVWSAWSNDHLSPSVASPPTPAVANAAPAQHPTVHVRAATKTLQHSTALVVRAVDGRCWVQARTGGPTGAVIAERTLEQGDSLRLTQQNVWLRLGAPWNVRITRGARAVTLQPSTEPLNVTA